PRGLAQHDRVGTAFARQLYAGVYQGRPEVPVVIAAGSGHGAYVVSVHKMCKGGSVVAVNFDPGAIAMNPPARRRLILAAVCLAAFAINVDTTIVNVALPSLT